MKDRSDGILEQGLRFLFLAGLAAAGAFGQCTYTVSPTAPFIDNAAQGGITIQVTASAPTCAWTAASSGFATASAPAGATGNGSVTYFATANGAGVDRVANLTVAGQNVALTQRWTASTFSDVLPSSFYFNGANLMRQNAITSGCATVPTLQYCGDQNVTRRQMAVFIVRTIYGGGAASNNFTYSTTPYFTDVPSTDANFKYVQKMRDLGVTSGCTATKYCPDDNVTRDQMAVFIVRARLGATAAYTFNPAPYFTDVPANYQPAPFFKAIQKLKEIGITAGCSATLYCPADFVTRGQMAIFLERAGFNALFTANTPLLSSVSPNSGTPGGTALVTLTGISTNFAAGTTVVTASNGVTAGAATVTDATHLTVTLTIPQATALGPISLTATTGAEQATIPNGFNVGLGDPLPTITSFTPASGPIGTAVTLTGTGLVSSAGTPADVRLVLQGGGIVSAPLTASSATSLSFVIPSTAATGAITVAGSSGSVTSATPFTITPSSTFTLTAGPSVGNLIAGQTATYTVNIASSNGFSGLAALSLISGVPAGVTAVFKPTQIAVGQQSVLTLTAPANQASSTSTLVIGAAATVDGIGLSLSTSATLNVTPITTSFLGRTVVDNGTQTSLVGVTVKMLGKDGGGGTTGCTGQTVSDASGNFALTGLAASCIGPQLIGFGGDNVTSPAGKYAGVNLVFTLVSGQVVVSPVLVHLPRIDNVETFLVKQNSNADQSYVYKSIPGLSITVYAGTVFTEADGSQPDPFPLAAIEVPVDRLPDVMPPTTATVSAFIVAFQPANTTASKGVAVWFPNTLNTPPGTNVPLATLDPTRGRMVPYGTGTVSNDGTTIIPDVDPATGAANHRFGIVHFDWHGPSTPPNPKNPGGKGGPKGGEPVDLSSGILVSTIRDVALQSGRGGIDLVRTYRTLTNNVGPFGIGTNHNYGYRLNSLAPQNQATVSLIMPDGNQIPFVRQSNGTFTNVTSPDVAGAVLTAVSDGTSTLRWKDGLQFHFIPGNFQTGSVLTGIDDPNGNSTTLTRNPNAPIEISKITDPSGRALILAYDGASRVTSVTDPIGRTINYTYTADGHLSTVTDMGGGVTTWLYNGQGQVTKVTDPRGNAAFVNTYDGNGYVASQAQADGAVFTFAYTLVNSLVPTSPVETTLMTDPLGNQTTYRFNAQGYVIGVTDASGQVRNIGRQPGTNLITSLAGSGNCPDVCGDPKLGDLTFTYDGLGNLLTKTDANGNITSYTYEPAFSRLASVTDPLGNTTTLTHDAAGNLTSVTDPLLHITSYQYNSVGDLTQLTDPNGKKISYTYDTNGNVTSATDPAGSKTSYAYDAVSRLVKTQDPAGAIRQIQYDKMENVVSRTDENGGTSNFTYDGNRNLLTATDPLGHKVSFTYDAVNRMVKRQDGLQRAETFAYDSDGHVTGYTDRLGNAAQATYNSLGFLSDATYQDGSSVVRSYDISGRSIRIADSAGGTFNYAYDAVGSLVGTTSPYGALQYTRDKNRRVLSRKVTGGGQLNYAYDGAGNLTAASLGSASVSLKYDARNQLTQITRSNGVTTTRTYDARGQLMSIVHANGGNVLNSQTNTYDVRGNRSGSTTDLGTALITQSASSASYDAADEQLVFGASTYTYNANGDRLTEVAPGGTNSYTWDARGRLQAIQTPQGQTIALSYDPGGNLIRQRTTGNGQDIITTYTLDVFSNVASRKVGNSSLENFLSGPSADQTFAYIDAAGQSHFALDDAISNIVGNSGSGGTLDGKASYEPFGQTTTSNAVYPFGFGGRSAVTGALFYYRSRFYDSVAGRFLNEDTTGLGLNLYRFENNNPLRFTDPFGLAPGDSYPTADAAGTQAIKDINAKSISDNLEYAGRVYKKPDGTYSYTAPRKGTPAGSTAGPVPPGKTNAGDYHTHGAYDPNYDNENFSGAGGDKEGNDKENVPGYLGTPNGDIKKYQPNGTPLGGTVTNLGSTK